MQCRGKNMRSDANPDMVHVRRRGKPVELKGPSDAGTGRRGRKGARKTQIPLSPSGRRSADSLVKGNKRTPGGTGIELTWAAYPSSFGISDHFPPVGEPAGQPSESEHNRKHIGRDTHGPVNDAAVKINVGIQVPADEISSCRTLSSSSLAISSRGSLTFRADRVSAQDFLMIRARGSKVLYTRCPKPKAGRDHYGLLPCGYTFRNPCRRHICLQAFQRPPGPHRHAGAPRGR